MMNWEGAYFKVLSHQFPGMDFGLLNDTVSSTVVK